MQIVPVVFDSDSGMNRWKKSDVRDAEPGCLAQIIVISKYIVKTAAISIQLISCANINRRKKKL